MLVWMLRRQLLVQLHTFVFLCENTAQNSNSAKNRTDSPSQQLNSGFDDVPQMPQTHRLNAATEEFGDKLRADILWQCGELRKVLNDDSVWIQEVAGI